MYFFFSLTINLTILFFLILQILIIIKCERLPEEILLDLKVPKCPNGQNALIDADGLTKCGSGCPDGFNCFKNESEISEYCCPDIDLLHKLYDNIDRDFYLNTMKKYPEPKALTAKDVETAFPIFPSNNIWSDLASFPNTKINGIYDKFINNEKNKKLMKISVLSSHNNNVVEEKIVNSTTFTNTSIAINSTISTNNTTATNSTIATNSTKVTNKTIPINSTINTNSTIDRNNTITNLTVKQQNSTNDILLKHILTPINNNTISTKINSTSKPPIKILKESKTFQIIKTTTTSITTMITTTAKTLTTSSTTSLNNNQNNIRRKPLPHELNMESVNDINTLSHQTFVFAEGLNNLQLPERSKFLDEEDIEKDLPLAALYYYCQRHSLNYTCNNGTVLTQFVTRWYAKDNQCHTYTWSFCPGDTIAMDKSLRSKEECEEICLKHGQKINSDVSSKVVKSNERNDNNIIDEINNNTDPKFLKNFDLTDIDEIVKTMTIEDRTKLSTNQKTFASKIVDEDNSKHVLSNGQDTEVFQIHDNLKQFICVRPDTFAHICPDGFPSQLTLRWFVYENQCITFPYGYCHGDRVTEEAFAKTKKECEEHCLMSDHEETDIV